MNYCKFLVIFFVCIGFFRLTNCDEVQLTLCPGTGPLHLPPPGCALKKHLNPEQNCFTFGVVCREGQGIGSTQANIEGTPATSAAATVAETVPESTATPTAEITEATGTPSAAATTENAGATTGGTSPAATSEQPASVGAETTETTSAAATSGAATSEPTVAESTLTTPTSETNETTIAAATSGASVETTENPVGNETVIDTEPDILPLPVEGDIAPLPINLPSGVVPANPVPGQIVAPVSNSSASADVKSESQPASAEPKRLCPFPNETAEAADGCDKNQKPCNANSECSVTQQCCDDSVCGFSICKESVLECPPDDKEEPVPPSAECPVKPIFDKARNCIKMAVVCT